MPNPKITFQVDLSLNKSEQFGPIGNEKYVSVLHPDRHQSNQDNAILENSNRVNLVSGFLPNLTLNNKNLKNVDTFVEYGQKAIYLRDTYGIGYAPSDRSYLKIISVE